MLSQDLERLAMKILTWQQRCTTNAIVAWLLQGLQSILWLDWGLLTIRELRPATSVEVTGPREENTTVIF